MKYLTRVNSAARSTFLSVTLIATFAFSLSSWANEKTIISNVNIIDLRTGDIHQHKDVIIDQDRIAKIRSHANPNRKKDQNKNKNSTVINAKGKYLIPGLMDMHIHYYAEDNMALNLANGVTLIRSMWGDEDVRKKIANLKETPESGPTLYSTSELIDGDPPIWKPSIVAADAKQAREVVIAQKDLGFDSLKVYSRLSPQAFTAISKTAKEHQMTIVGHIPVEVGTESAVKQGMDDIHHITDILVYLQSDDSPFGKMSRTQLAAEYDKDRRKFSIELAKFVDKNKIERYAAFLKENGVWSTVTLLVNKNINLTPRARQALFEDERLKYVNQEVRDFWDPKNDFRLKNTSAEQFEALSDNFPIWLEVTRALDKAGAKILLGTDTPNPFIYPGFSVHEELALMVEAGLSPLSALQTATINPAEFLKRDDLGEVKVGAIADLVLLDNNPLTDIRNTRRIAGVINKGKWFSPAQLTQMLEEVEQNNRAQ